MLLENPLPLVICAAVPLFLVLAFNGLPRMNRAAVETARATHAPESELLVFVVYLIGGWLGLVVAGGLLSLVFVIIAPDVLVTIWALTCGAMLVFAFLWGLQVMRFPFFGDRA